ncbi:YwiC-like family protein [Actinoplanes sp. KI2]|uniref:YwiC-like family protein n=1 Tax=Actinoplanes sp. KI2 TaxID=2983315 RepID=UPI0021D6137E|nr:YwiC-like family protein [Actinoplanes sp. KI2]MCU7729092.1 YwiC-like family protein [Actinoplanes sp. KI2]
MSAPAAVARRRAVRQFVPPQHGAWAMLLLPYLAGVLAAGFRWPDLPLLGAWLSGYLLSYFALQAVKTRRPQRFREPLFWYAPITAALSLAVVVARPRVLLFAPVFAVLLAVNAWYAARRRDRALVNDLALVVQSCLMVFVVAVVAGQPPGRVLTPFLVVLLYFAGTVLYVKTMIRERGSRAYRRASMAFHLFALVVAAALGPVPAVVFALLLARAWLAPGRGLTPKQVGLAEIVASALVLIAAVV